MTSAPPASSPRRRVAVVVAVVSIASLAVGLVAGRSLRSPADAAADRLAPAASAVRVPVEERVLASAVTGRGDVAFVDAVSLEVAEADAVITEAPPAVGTEVREGDVVLEVSERPMLVLAGVVPMYRDLVPGSSGADVVQLESALRRLGYDPGPLDGTLDQSTEAALARLYVARGATPPEPSEAGRVRLATARATLAQLEAEDPEAAVSTAEADLAAAQERAAATVQQADAEVRAAELARIRAESDARRARDRTASAAAGHHPDTGEPPTPGEVAELQAEADRADDAAEVARGAEAAARSARQATAAEQRAVVAHAQQAAEAARARRADPRTASVLRDARREVAAAEGAAGAVVPRDELRFVPVLPARVTLVEVALGDPATGVLAELSGRQLAVEIEVPAADADGIETGLEAEVIGRDPDLTVPGRVIEVRPAGPAADQRSGSTGTAVVRVALDHLEAPALRGRNVQVKVPVSTTRTAVLAVPLAAIAGRADGTTWIERERAGRVRDVAVRTGLSADGYVEVRPSSAGDLRAGDLVTVGVTARGG